MSEQFLLSDKYKVFLKRDAPVEFLEGATFAGKTTVGVPKFMFRVADSPKKLHVLSGLDLETIYNIQYSKRAKDNLCTGL